MIRFITNLFARTESQVEQRPAKRPVTPMFDVLETRCLLSASAMASDVMENDNDAAAIVMKAAAKQAPAKAAAKTQKLNLKGDYEGLVTITGFPTPLPFAMSITGQKGANVKGTVSAATLQDAKFSGAVTKKNGFNGTFKNAQGSGTFKAKVNADGTVTGTVTLKIGGQKVAATFSLTKVGAA